jgi:hypothetical protein
MTLRSDCFEAIDAWNSDQNNLAKLNDALQKTKAYVTGNEPIDDDFKDMLKGLGRSMVDKKVELLEIAKNMEQMVPPEIVDEILKYT